VTRNSFTVLAFDTAIKTGVAVGSTGAAPRTTTINLGKASWEVRYARMLRLVERYVTDFSPDLVAVESPAAGGFQNLDLIGLTVCVRAQAARMGVRSVSYMPNSVRKHFLGKALSARDFPGKTRAAAKGAIKAQVIARCQLLGWDITDPDAADAAALWDFALSKESRAHQVTTLGGLFGKERG
jgi:Holliday junction resolvasome RuvABC endonuclease subunit